MASIRKRTLSDGATAYIVRWTDPAGREQTRQFSKATGTRPAEAAKDFKTRIEDELRRGTYVDPRAGEITVRDFVADTRPGLLHLRDSTQERLDIALSTHILPLIGNMKIGAVRRREIQQMVNALSVKPAQVRGGAPARPLAPRTVRYLYRIAAGIFRSAVLDGIIPASPCVKITLPKVPDDEVIIPTTEQVGQIVMALPRRYQALVLLASGSGLRSAELRGLDLDRLRVLERVVRVDRQLTFPSGGGHSYGPPKTDAGYRTVPLAPSYIQDVAEHLEEFGTGTDGLIFTSSSGRPLRGQTLSGVLRPVLAAHGFPEGTGMHLFRHYYASLLIAGGVDIQTVMRNLGHGSSAETLGTYGHLWPGHEERTREATAAAHPSGHRDHLRTTKTATGPRHGGAQVTPLSRHAH